MIKWGQPNGAYVNTHMHLNPSFCLGTILYMPGASQRGGSHNVWVTPPCEVPYIYAGYRIYHLLQNT